MKEFRAELTDEDYRVLVAIARRKGLTLEECVVRVIEAYLLDEARSKTSSIRN